MTAEVRSNCHDDSECAYTSQSTIDNGEMTTQCWAETIRIPYQNAIESGKQRNYPFIIPNYYRICNVLARDTCVDAQVYATFTPVYWLCEYTVDASFDNTIWHLLSLYFAP